MKLKRGESSGDFMQNVHILIKPASGNCNLDCKYCFYRDLGEKRAQKSFGFMEEQTLEAVIKAGFSCAARECAFAFQGGEPTLAGLPFFEKAVALQKKYNTKKIAVHNALQTNGLGLDAKWAEFFKENHFLVGLSLDGVAETHDHNRVDPSGGGTFSRVMETVRLFEKYGVEYNILTVVNRQTAKDVNRIYAFFKENNLKYLQFIPCLDPYGEAPGQRDYSLTPRSYGEFLIALFDLWYQDIESGQPVFIRQFENYLEMLLGLPPESCGMRGVCGFQHVIEADGSVYPCDFYVLDEYRLGNLNVHTLDEINGKRKEIGFIEASAVIAPKCASCEYFPLCRGGCRRHRPFGKDGTPGLNLFCESYEMFFAHAALKLRALAREIAMFPRDEK